MFVRTEVDETSSPEAPMVIPPSVSKPRKIVESEIVRMVKQFLIVNFSIGHRVNTRNSNHIRATDEIEHI